MKLILPRLLLLDLILLLTYLQGNSQVESFQNKVVQILEPQTFYLNSKTKIGGKNRIDFQIILPENTVEWYYSFTTAENKDANSASGLNLLTQLSRLVDETGISATALQTVFSPTGTYVCDAYLMNAPGRQEFYQTNEMGGWSYTKPSSYLEGTRENFKNGVIPIKQLTSGTFYLGFRDPSTTEGEWITLEVAAVVQERVTLDRWSSENRQKLYDYFSSNFINHNEASTEVCNCAVNRMISRITPSQYTSLNEIERKNYCAGVLDSCYILTGHADIKESQQDAIKLSNEIQADVLAKDFSSCADKSIELINRGYDAYNDAGWCLLFTKQFDEALKYLAEGAVKDPSNLYLRGNLAHAYLLTNHFEDAKKLYLDNKKEKLSKGLSWKEMVDQDFRSFQAEGIQSPHFDEIRKLLKIKGQKNSHLL